VTRPGLAIEKVGPCAYGRSRKAPPGFGGWNPRLGFGRGGTPEPHRLLPSTDPKAEGAGAKGNDVRQQLSRVAGSRAPGGQPGVPSDRAHARIRPPPDPAQMSPFFGRATRRFRCRGGGGASLPREGPPRRLVVAVS
jgi:hypothetical protein